MTEKERHIRNVRRRKHLRWQCIRHSMEIDKALKQPDNINLNQLVRLVNITMPRILRMDNLHIEAINAAEASRLHNQSGTVSRPSISS